MNRLLQIPIAFEVRVVRLHARCQGMMYFPQDWIALIKNSFFLLFARSDVPAFRPEEGVVEEVLPSRTPPEPFLQVYGFHKAHPLGRGHSRSLRSYKSF